MVIGTRTTRRLAMVCLHIRRFAKSALKAIAPPVPLILASVLVLSALLVIAPSASLIPIQPMASEISASTSMHPDQQLVAAGDCQSQLWGRWVGTTSGVAASALVILDGNDRTLVTRSDAIGVFGFGSLCAGEYLIRIQVGNQSVLLPNRFELNGHNTLRRDLLFP